jgi:hypothetical protein
MAASQKYCGMCGAKQAQQEQEFDTLPVRDLSADEQPREETPRYERDTHEYREPVLGATGHDVYEPRSTRNEFSLFQLERERDYADGDDEIFSYDPPSHPYRAYVGIVLAIVILVLGYMAWRSSQTGSQTTHIQSQAPPAVAAQPPAAAPEPNAPGTTERTDTPDRTASPEKQPAAPAHSKAAVNRSEKATDEVPSDAADAENSTLAHPAAGNGSQELAMAQHYLSGAGAQRNSTEGAKWLWKAMAKHNSTAMLLLADLYLKGDGVSKNCEQAHVLLDSAARGGLKQAGERLRHLQAFGCE